MPGDFLLTQMLRYLDMYALMQAQRRIPAVPNNGVDPAFFPGSPRPRNIRHGQFSILGCFRHILVVYWLDFAYYTI